MFIEIAYLIKRLFYKGLFYLSRNNHWVVIKVMMRTLIKQRVIPDETDISALVVRDAFLSKIWAARGITSVAQVDHSLNGLLHYQALKDIDKAVSLLLRALKTQKSILIIGDYDADGATSTALMVEVLKAFGAQNVNFIVPNRFEYGYGLTPEIVELGLQYKPELLITVDNGIASIEGVAYAKEKGIDVLVTDHHLQGATLPDADAIVNPNQHACNFASKSLCGVGVAFYVLTALRAALVEINWFEARDIALPKMSRWLDIVALGTVADVVSLDFNNRIFVQAGLDRMRVGAIRPGIRALLLSAKRDLVGLQASDLAFAVAPRLNAAGRLDDMSLGIQCLLSTDEVTAQHYAQQLNDLNIERRQIEASMQAEAQAALDKLVQADSELPAGICQYDATWHQGVVGILASRIKDKYHRPVIVFADESETLMKGSGRSIEGVHIRDILFEISVEHPEYIVKFGGHAMAAGLTLHKQYYEAFQTLFAQKVGKLLHDELGVRILYTDGEIASHHMTLNNAYAIRMSGPWGQHFPSPLFEGEFQIMDQKIVGEKHLKCALLDTRSGNVFPAIAFNVDLKKWPSEQGISVTVVYQLSVNSFRGNDSLQLMIEYIDSID